MQLSQLINDVFSRLGENSNSYVAALMQSTSQTPVLTSVQVITNLLNEGCAKLAREYMPIQDTITYTWPANQQFALYSALNCVNNSLNLAHGVRSITWTGGNIKFAERGPVENWPAQELVDSNGNPLYWFDDGIEGIGVSVAPTVATAITGRVIVVPAPMVNPTDMPQGPYDLSKLPVFYACGQIIEKKKSDPVFQAIGQDYMAMFTDGAESVLELLWRRDPDLVNDLLKRNRQADTKEVQHVN